LGAAFDEVQLHVGVLGERCPAVGDDGHIHGLRIGGNTDRHGSCRDHVTRCARSGSDVETSLGGGLLVTRIDDKGRAVTREASAHVGVAL
jgi:hypothetical protein